MAGCELATEDEPMTTDDEAQVEALRHLATRSGLTLTDEELDKLVAGVTRNREMAARARVIVSPQTEPAPVFEAGARESEQR
jgi:hypothetical protein